LANIYEIEFEEMYVDGRFGTHKIDNSPHTLLIEGTPVEIYFSPSDEAMSQVIAEVTAASDSIYFSIFFLTNDDLRDALIAKMAEGIAVYGLWDALGASNFYSDDEALCAAGAFINIENFPGKMHHKFMVIDPGEADATVITGSMNWSKAGDEANDENTLILHDEELAAAYMSGYQTLAQALPLSRWCNTETTYLPLIVAP
jgi:phosphatidylserine/phosphatidylglycerophosphate/cardiolipin synthase-like enzyme